MDFQEEKDAYLSELLAREAISQDEFDDIIFRPSVNAFESLYLSARFIDNINWGWNSWLAAKAQAVPEGFVLVPAKNVKYFSNDGENYEIHDTLAEAKHEAECAIEHFSERLADQLCDPREDGNFQDVGYGVILGHSAYSLDHVVIQEDIDNGDYSYDMGTEIMSLFLVEAQEPTND